MPCLIAAKSKEHLFISWVMTPKLLYELISAQWTLTYVWNISMDSVDITENGRLYTVDFFKVAQLLLIIFFIISF